MIFEYKDMTKEIRENIEKTRYLQKHCKIQAKYYNCE